MTNLYSSFPLQGYFSVHGISLNGSVTDIQKEALTIILPSPCESIKPDYLIESILLNTANGKQFKIEQGRVVSITLRAQETELRIDTNDPASQAILWSLAYEQKHQRPVQPDLSIEEPTIPHRGHYSTAAWQERLNWLRQQIEQPLEHLETTQLQPEQLKGNIENFIGAVQVPVGLAGPLLLRGQYAQGYHFAPFATTEGALVASACRGAKALSKSGGVHTYVMAQQMMRAPVFITESCQDALQLQAWLLDHRKEIEAKVSGTSRHAQLLRMEPFILGRTLHVRFVYQTGDASGQNMTTACTWKVCQWIMAQMHYYPAIRIQNFYIESNMSGDKKVNYLNFGSGRGIRVVAEAVLSHEVLRQVLKIEADELLEGVSHFMNGSTQLGMLGFNINIANTIAAIFAATGQDIACVHESSIGQLSIQKHPVGVYASLVLPSLIIATVGGGTGLPTQRDCLKVMGCAGTGQVNKLAEIIAGFCLALDLSTLSSIVSGQFASAHERLGRNRPEDGLKEEHLAPAFFEEVLAAKEKGEAIQLSSVQPLPLDIGNSILSDLTSNQLKKKVGHFLYKADYMQKGLNKESKVLIKAKPTDHEVVNMLNQMAQACGSPLANLYDLHKFDTGFKNCHLRELEMYRLTDPRFTAIAPAIYKVWQEDKQEIYAVAMEYLEEVTHLNTVNDVSQWKEEHIKVALKDMAAFHSLFLGQQEQLQAKKWLHQPDGASTQRLIPLWKALLAHHANEFPDLYTPQRVELLEKAIAAIPQAWIKLDKAPHTLVHNDFNLRNCCLRPTPEGLRLCVYDWELAALHVPQYDVCEFLAFVLPPEVSPQVRLPYVDFYRKELEKQSGKHFDAGDFLEIFNLACLDFAYNRLALYGMAHTFKCYPFMPRVLNSHLNYVEMVLGNKMEEVSI